MNAELFDCRKAYAETLEKIAESDDRLVVVVNDSVGSSNLKGFEKRFPERLINVGIAEQNQVGVAAGLENCGKIPVVSCAGSFLSARAMEQIKIDAAYSERHMLLCAQSPGLAYGQLGSTHHSAEDSAWMRAIPNMTVIIPADPAETEAAVRWAYSECKGPVYIRISRMKVPRLYGGELHLERGKAIRLRDGGDVTLIANGVCVSRALVAAARLADEGIEARVVSMPFVKPLDIDEIVAASEETGGIITIEEGVVAGGLGSAVAEVLADRGLGRVRRLGVPDVFAPTGSEEWLLDHFGMSSESIRATARQMIAK